MKQKLLALLLTLTFVFSMAPLTVFAADNAKDPNHECDFAAGSVSNHDGTHKTYCSCGDSVTYKCYDYDGDHACDSCGYKMGCLYDAGVTSNNDGTHNVNCSCGNYMTVKCLDSDGDGKCDSCGYLMYCNHTSKSVRNNGDGTHTFFCRDCGKELTTEEHKYSEATDACLCGALKPAAVTPTEEPTPSEKPTPTEKPSEDSKPSATEKPAATSKPSATEKPAESSKPSATETSSKTTSAEPVAASSVESSASADVAQTGDSGNVMLWAILLIASLLGAAGCVYAKKKFL